MTEYEFKTVDVIGFDELMGALDRADRNGYMPNAIREEWEAFNWKPAQRKPLTDEQIMKIIAPFPFLLNTETEKWLIGFARAIEAKLKEKNNG